MCKELFHSLEGENICFRALDTKDSEAVHSYASDKNVKRFIGWPLMKNLEETRNYLAELIKREAAGTHLYASIALKATGEIIGTAMIFNFDHDARHGELGYVFHSRYWGKGYGTEAVAMMSDFAFDELKLRKLHARVIDANVGSARVLEKNGFTQEGRLKDYYLIDSSLCDLILFARFKP